MRFLHSLMTPFRRPAQTKSSAAGPMIAWSGIGLPRWTPRRFDHLAEEGFRKNVVAYRCVMTIATACASVPWLLYDDATGAEIDQHPILDLLEHPNPLQDGVSFMESVYADLEIAGNAYIEAVRPHNGGAPVELYVLRPDRMKVVPGSTGLPQGYQYSVNGQVSTWACDPVSGASDILHLKRFHPLDDWYGMAPMEAALLSIDQHNAAGAWNQSLLGQGARPSGALVYAPKDGPATLTDDQIRRLREEMGNVYQGDRNAGRPMILEGGLDWKEMSLSPKDMDWLAGRNNAARDIAVAFGVPAQMIGIPDAQTYANMAEARMAFYEETVLPNLTRVTAALDHWLCPMYRDPVWLDFDADSISALADKKQTQWNRIRDAHFLTRNEMREAAGYAPVAGGDEGGDNDIEPEPAHAKYSADQPRVPAGSPDGGQWTSGGGGSGANSDAITPVYPLESAILLLLGGASALGDAVGGEAAGGAAADTALGDASSYTQRFIDMLTPNGSLIGEAGSRSWIRELPGGSDAAEQMFQDLTEGGIPDLPATYSGSQGFRMPDDSWIGYRPTSTSGPPTIDLNIVPLRDTIRKLKFLVTD